MKVKNTMSDSSSLSSLPTNNGSLIFNSQDYGKGRRTILRHSDLFLIMTNLRDHCLASLRHPTSDS